MSANIKFKTGKTYKGQFNFEQVTISRRTEKSVWDTEGNRYKVNPFTRTEEGQTVESIESTTGKFNSLIFANRAA